MPAMPEGFPRCFDIPVPAADPAAGVDDEEANALDIIQRWRDVMISSFTVLLSGEKSAFMDFNFLPAWLEGMSSLDVTDDRAVQHAFELFILKLFSQVATREAAIGQTRKWSSTTSSLPIRGISGRATGRCTMQQRRSGRS